MRVQERPTRRNSYYKKIGRAVQGNADQLLDGTSAELVREPATGHLSWLVFDQNSSKISRQVEFQDLASAPAGFNPSILRAITLPSKCGNLRPTAELFAAVREPLTRHGFPEIVAFPASYFIFSSWFPECLPVAPCLWITGPRHESDLLLQLLRCMVRHPLPLRDVTRGGLFSLPMDLQLTLLIAQEKMSRSIWELLCASNHRNAYIPLKGSLQNIFCAKAVYRGFGYAEENFDDSALHINLSPSQGRFPILDPKEMQEIVENLQPALLAYRLRNIAKVRESMFDLPELSSGIRILARVLGAPIVGSPELQAGLVPVLREYHEESMAAHWFDPRCIAIEAALYHCHNGEEGKIHVGKITDTANAILKGRGKTTQLEAKEIGTILRSQGLSPKRDRKGFAIRLDDRICRQIHQLANSFHVAAAQADIGMCTHCAEITAAAANGNRIGAIPKGR
jgi:hypothetical protein